ncbi:MAG: hypothetical protein N4A49_06015 [Marinifilaceae bacterium]|nr:hypothetical protein [Marinifilaceae bacterium]
MKNFDENIHSDIYENLINSYKQSKIPHAQLFDSKYGYGALLIIISYIKYICCKDKQGDKFCNTCPSCLKINNLSHPDLNFVFPVVKKSGNKSISDSYFEIWKEMILENPFSDLVSWTNKLDSGNSQLAIFADESREIVQKFSTHPYEADYKFMVIWGLDKMNIQSANKLLKILEEPQPNQLFFMISDNSESILPTIISRVQRISLNRLSDTEIVKLLANHYNLNIDESSQYSRLSKGDYNKALELLSTSSQNGTYLEYFKEIMRYSYSNKVLQIMEWSDKLADMSREEHKQFITYSLNLIRENYIMNHRIKDIVYLNKSEEEFSTKFSQFINDTNILQINEEFNSAYSDLISNGVAKFIFLDLGLKLVKLINSK